MNTLYVCLYFALTYTWQQDKFICKTDAWWESCFRAHGCVFLLSKLKSWWLGINWNYCCSWLMMMFAQIYLKTKLLGGLHPIKTLCCLKGLGFGHFVFWIKWPETGQCWVSVVKDGFVKSNMSIWGCKNAVLGGGGDRALIQCSVSPRLWGRASCLSDLDFSQG